MASETTTPMREGGTASETSAESAPLFRAVHHIGMTVANLDRSIAFWEGLLGTRALWRQVLDAPYLARVTGYPTVRLDACLLDLPGGVRLELLRYLDQDEAANDPATARPGNLHLCLQVDDLHRQWVRAVALGARPVGEGPVAITAGPNRGAQTGYLRTPDGVTLELFQAPTAS